MIVSSATKHNTPKCPRNKMHQRVGRRAFLLLPPALSANASELQSENTYTFQSKTQTFALVMRIYEDEQCVRLDKNIEWFDIVQHKQRLESETKLYLLNSKFV